MNHQGVRPIGARIRASGLRPIGFDRIINPPPRAPPHRPKGGPRALPLKPGRALPCTHKRPGAFEIPFWKEGVGIGHSLEFIWAKPWVSKGHRLWWVLQGQSPWKCASALILTPMAAPLLRRSLLLQPNPIDPKPLDRRLPPSATRPPACFPSHPPARPRRGGATRPRRRACRPASAPRPGPGRISTGPAHAYPNSL